MDFIPDIRAVATYMPLVDGVQLEQPMAYVTMAEYINSSSSGVHSGRFNSAKNVIESYPTVVLSDTYISGTSGRTGVAFSVVKPVSGSYWKDDWVSPSTHKYGMRFGNATSNTEFEVLETTPSSTLEHRRVTFGISVPPPGTTDTHSASGRYLYLELNSGGSSEYRITMAWSKPVSLEYRVNSGTWKTVSTASWLDNLENYLKANNETIELTIAPDMDDGVMLVYIGTNDKPLRHSPPHKGSIYKATTVPELPSTQRYRVTGKNMILHFELSLLRYGTLTATTTKNRGASPTGAKSGDVRHNTTAQRADQIEGATLAQNGNGDLELSGTYSRPDAGEGSGSYYPPVLADVSVYYPGLWAYTPPTIAIPMARLPVREYLEVQEWNEGARYARTYGKLTVDNSDGWYTGLVGQYAVDIAAANGWVSGQRMRGVLGYGSDGVVLSRKDPDNYLEIPIHDASIKLQDEMVNDVILDGYSAHTAIRLLCNLGNIGPHALQGIPDYGPPPYGDGFPFPILGAGTPVAPRYRFGAGTRVLDAILKIAADVEHLIVDVWGNVFAFPYVFYMDEFGNARFEPRIVQNQRMVKFYSSAACDDSQIIGELKVYNSAENLRTDIHLQGIDPYTFDLLELDIPLPGNIWRTGWRRPLLDRSAKFVDQYQMEQLGRMATYMSSIPTQTVQFSAIYDPRVHAGQVIGVADDRALGRAGLFSIIRLESRLMVPGPLGGATACVSNILARSVESEVLG